MKIILHLQIYLYSWGSSESSFSFQYTITQFLRNMSGLIAFYKQITGIPDPSRYHYLPINLKPRLGMRRLLKFKILSRSNVLLQLLQVAIKSHPLNHCYLMEVE